jgi:hypothetical protein
MHSSGNTAKKGLKLAQLLGQLGVFLTLKSAVQVLARLSDALLLPALAGAFGLETDKVCVLFIISTVDQLTERITHRF